MKIYLKLKIWILKHDLKHDEKKDFTLCPIKLQNTKSYNEKAAWDIPWSLSRLLCSNVRSLGLTCS